LTELSGNQIHFQIKENNDDLDDRPVIRGTISSGHRKGQPSDLSPFDKSIEALRIWFKNNPNPTVRTTKKFVFVSPFQNVAIKKNLSLMALYELCNEEIRTNTNVQGLQNLANASGKIKAIIEWLTNWCGFSDW